MAAERRFQAGFEEEATDEPGLVLDETGTVWKVAPGGTRTEVGGSGLLTATRVFDNDEIRALPTTPVELVPAPGSGKMLYTDAAELGLGILSIVYGDPATGDYSNFDATNLVFRFALGDAVGFTYTDYSKGNAHWLFHWGSSPAVYQLSPAELTTNQNILQDRAIVEDQPLLFSIANGNNGDLEDGHADNTLTVTVFYAVIDL